VGAIGKDFHLQTITPCKIRDEPGGRSLAGGPDLRRRIAPAVFVSSDEEVDAPFSRPSKRGATNAGASCLFVNLEITPNLACCLLQ